MPIIKSAKKRVKVAARANARNVRTKQNMHEAVKAYIAAIGDGKAKSISEAKAKAESDRMFIPHQGT